MDLFVLLGAVTFAFAAGAPGSGGLSVRAEVLGFNRGEFSHRRSVSGHVAAAADVESFGLTLGLSEEFVEFVLVGALHLKRSAVQRLDTALECSILVDGHGA